MFTILLLGSLVLGLVIAAFGAFGTKDHNSGRRGWW